MLITATLPCDTFQMTLIIISYDGMNNWTSKCAQTVSFLVVTPQRTDTLDNFYYSLALRTFYAWKDLDSSGTTFDVARFDELFSLVDRMKIILHFNK